MSRTRDEGIDLCTVSILLWTSVLFFLQPMLLLKLLKKYCIGNKRMLAFSEFWLWHEGNSWKIRNKEQIFNEMNLFYNNLCPYSTDRPPLIIPQSNDMTILITLPTFNIIFHDSLYVYNIWLQNDRVTRIVII